MRSKNMRYWVKHRRQFPPGPRVRTRPLLRHGRVQTSVDLLTRPNVRKVKKSVTDVSVMSPDMLLIAFQFQPIKHRARQSSGRMVDSPCTLFSIRGKWIGVDRAANLLTSKKKWESNIEHCNSCDFESVLLAPCHIKIHNYKFNAEKTRWIKVLPVLYPNALKLVYKMIFFLRLIP